MATDYESFSIEVLLGDDRLDEVPVELTQEELYAGASEEELNQLTKEAFFEGFSRYQKELAKLVRPRPRQNLLPETREDYLNGLIEGVLPYVAWRVRERFLLHTAGVMVMDRVQNGNIYVASAAKKYDSTQGGFISMFEPLLNENIRRTERGGVGLRSPYPVNEGELIRIRHGMFAYFKLKNFHTAKNFQFGRQLEVGELGQLSKFTDEELEEYEKFSVEHIPLHKLISEEDRTGLAAADVFIDDDPALDPYRVQADKVVSDRVTRTLNMLTDTESLVMVARLGLSGRPPMTLAETAEETEMTENQVRGRYYAAIKKLKELPGMRNVLLGVEPQEEAETPVLDLSSQEQKEGRDDSDPVFVPYWPLIGPEGSEASDDDGPMSLATINEKGAVAVIATSKYITANYLANELFVNRTYAHLIIHKFLDGGLIERVSEGRINSEISMMRAADHYKRTATLDAYIKCRWVLRDAIIEREKHKLPTNN